MAVGKVSLEDCDLFISSFGWILIPHFSFIKLEITSLTFMLVWVPEPVCQTTNGKWESNFPDSISSQAIVITSYFSFDKLDNL